MPSSLYTMLKWESIKKALSVKKLMDTPDFAEEPLFMSAELEMYLIVHQGCLVSSKYGNIICITVYGYPNVSSHCLTV